MYRPTGVLQRYEVKSSKEVYNPHHKSLAKVNRKCVVGAENERDAIFLAEEYNTALFLKGEGRYEVKAIKPL